MQQFILVTLAQLDLLVKPVMFCKKDNQGDSRAIGKSGQTGQPGATGLTAETGATGNSGNPALTWLTG